MEKTVKSFGHSIEGFREAWKHERNLRGFVIGHLAVIFISISLRIDVFSLILLSLAAGFFIVVELLNTAIERLADTFDDCEKKTNSGHFHPGIKMTKDVGAAASLVALLLYLGLLTLIALPYAFLWLSSFGQ